MFFHPFTVFLFFFFFFQIWNKKKKKDQHISPERQLLGILGVEIICKLQTKNRGQKWCKNEQEKPINDMD
jgi:hypothetical protein